MDNIEKTGRKWTGDKASTTCPCVCTCYMYTPGNMIACMFAYTYN